MKSRAPTKRLRKIVYIVRFRASRIAHPASPVVTALRHAEGCRSPSKTRSSGRYRALGTAVASHCPPSGWPTGPAAATALRHQCTPCPTNHCSPAGCPRRGTVLPARARARPDPGSTMAGGGAVHGRAGSKPRSAPGWKPGPRGGPAHIPQLVRRSALAKSDRRRCLTRYPAGPPGKRPQLTRDGPGVRAPTSAAGRSPGRPPDPFPG